ncbi:hypothetical protein K435DRAFT_775210 [Dendrothele bispora CBS 962.96]|uniref:Mitochondrial K+-H+ exchange-related-domain-containing protein n=1 Tax=Dendrothele bispora (strain CBS 962.96) TaxID=1314807 RepID=A0A4S8MKD2_DENBC|nr:hypothetical protein K435DRAFT_775210 [Dendrothele bispora CBS 962.96]
MSVSRNLRSAHRIISLPITRNANLNHTNVTNGHHSTASSDPFTRAKERLPTNVLTYYHFQVHLSQRKKKQYEESDKLSKWNPRYWQQWAQTKAADTWAGFGKAPEGSWKLRVFRGGEAMVDRIDFEELALKGIDPSLGPTILHPDLQRKEEEAEQEGQDTKILLLYPPSIHSGAESLSYLRSLVQTRAPRHKKGFWIWMVAAPFTAPFMIVPIIPNLPFFFCVWRSWSHYRAYRASEYLTALIRHGHIVPEPSQLLDTIYRDLAPNSDSNTSSSSSSSASSISSNPASSSSTPNSNSESEKEPLLNKDNQSSKNATSTPPPHPHLLLTRDAVPAVVSAFDLKQSASADIYRALEQAKNRLRPPSGA